MNPKKMLKRIIGVALLVFVFCFSIIALAKPVDLDDGTGNTPKTDTGTGNNTTGNTNANTNTNNTPTNNNGESTTNVTYGGNTDAECPYVSKYNFCDTKVMKEFDSAQVVDKYGLQINYVSGNQYKIMMTTKVNDGVTFHIVETNNVKYTGKREELSYNKPVYVNIYDTIDEEGWGLEGVKVKLRSSCYVPHDSKPNKKCYWGHITAELFTTDGAIKSYQNTVSYKVGDIINAQFDSYSINCTKGEVTRNGSTSKYTAGSFEDKFCIAKKAALSTEGHSISAASTNGNPVNNTTPYKFSCDYNLNNSSTNPINTGALEGEGYFTNHQYLYGETSFSKGADIIFHLAPGAGSNEGHIIKSSISCDIKCEEAVEVEYGPPVASAAGMCFEYKVRVTSRVSCNMANAPSSTGLCKNTVCTPKPKCVHSSGEIYTQAGPSEDFDDCVNSCDGGLYTKKCSTSCYKKVYGGSISATAKTSSIYYDEVFGIKLNNRPKSKEASKGVSCDEGYYTKKMDSNGNAAEITWVSTQNNSKGYPGRWYCEGNNGTLAWNVKNVNRNGYSGYNYYVNFYSDKKGFFRKYYPRYDRVCDADCSWTECNTKDYLNTYVPCDKVPGMTADDKEKYCVHVRGDKKYVNILEYDCAKNQETYNSLVQQCQSMASCSTNQAEFTISAKYTKLGKTEDTWIKFPYNSDPDYLKSGDTISSSQTSKNSTLLPDYPTKDEGILGCYKSGSVKNLYRATWGFPGSWKNLKTNEVSYDPSVEKENQGSADGGGNISIWFPYRGKFCIPGDAKNVNGAWYNAYKHKQLVSSGVIDDLSLSQDAELGARCTKDGSIMKPVSNPKPDTYNIKAHTQDFGYFGWDIDIECFYAINDNILNTDDDECGPDSSEEGKKQGEEYRVRSTDLGNLFPSANGEDLASPDTAGRNPGYNWSKYAINTKNTDYKSNPVKYMQALQEAAKKAQSGGTEMYTNDNLDYQFYLTPTVLREMRKDRAGSGGSNYTSFSDSGFTVDNNGVGRYYSKKIRNLGSDNKLPLNNDSLYCNNMVNWQTPGCDTIHND